MYLWFQFRYGAIDGFPADPTDATSWEFQFRYGAIDGNCYASKLRCFTSFNSAMVQLMETELRSKVLLIIKFQFRYGAIDGKSFIN